MATESASRSASPSENPLIQQAKTDLATRLAIGEEQIEMTRMQEVTWSSAALGCPQPEMMYAQVLVDGAFIQLKVGDQLYNYHSGGNRAPFLCESENEQIP